MLQLGLATKPKLAVRYRHMMAEDTAIWRKFINNGDYLPDVVWFDVRVGDMGTLPENPPDWMTKMAWHLLRKRIDVVGRVGVDYWVIEVKPRASYEAFGQVVYYSYAFEREYKTGGEIVPVIVTDFVDPDILPLCSEVGVVVVEVGPGLFA